MEPRRVVLAVILMALVLIVVPMIFEPATPVARNGAGNADSVLADSIRRATPGTTPAPCAGGTGASGGSDYCSVARHGHRVSNSRRQRGPPDRHDRACRRASCDRHDCHHDFARRLPHDESGRVAHQCAASRLSCPSGWRPREGRGGGARESWRAPALFRLVVPGDTIRLDRQVFNATRTDAGGRATVTYYRERERRAPCPSSTRSCPTAIA